VPLTEDVDRTQTFAGMASWGGGGPPGKTCRECVNWDHHNRNVRQYFITSGELTPKRCLKAVQLMMRIDIPRVPYYARACKEFILNEHPPLQFRNAKTPI
jgi:hypothetical protein